MELSSDIALILKHNLKITLSLKNSKQEFNPLNHGGFLTLSKHKFISYVLTNGKQTDTTCYVCTLFFSFQMGVPTQHTIRSSIIKISSRARREPAILYHRIAIGPICRPVFLHGYINGCYTNKQSV